jgi:5-oxoprolinase (ATP-hydrolysing) subunit B
MSAAGTREPTSSAGTGCTPVGDAALLVEIDPGARHAAASTIAAAAIEGVVDIVPGECSVLVRFDPGRDLDAAASAVRVALDLTTQLGAAVPGDEITHEIIVPVRYDGPDLDDVAAMLRLSRSQVINRHLDGDYLVAFIGFAPGFAYLDGLPAALSVPRLATPRARVEPGSVAIAGARCCIYPGAMPGGWRLIGRTDLVLFDASVVPPSPLAPGRHVRFAEL